MIPYSSDSKNQSERWKHLIQLIQRQMLVYPGHSKARRTRVWRRFRQQMVDAEKVMQGQYLLIEAPNEKEAHDDYVDSRRPRLRLHDDGDGARTWSRSQPVLPVTPWWRS